MSLLFNIINAIVNGSNHNSLNKNQETNKKENKVENKFNNIKEVDNKKDIWPENEDEENKQIQLAIQQSENEAKLMLEREEEEERQLQFALKESEKENNKYFNINEINDNFIKENEEENEKEDIINNNKEDDEENEDDKGGEEENEEEKEEEKEEFDEEYGICPITQEYMENPVITPSGNYYEKKAIIDWINKEGTDPMTRERLTIDMLIEDNEYKKQIIEYRKKFNK